MKEIEVAHALMDAYPDMPELRPAIDRSSPFDFESDAYLVEIKVRRKAYDPWVIEEMKIDTNIGIAESVKKQFIYVTVYRDTIYVWNITKMKRADYDFGIEKRGMPHTTDFGGRGMITKLVGYLWNKDAIEIDISKK
jgi:hypothetical protein|tara:strand:- start:137 stop:547 length:411 start_codon:yes stop_codon:yes gene_type:complete